MRGTVECGVTGRGIWLGLFTVIMLLTGCESAQVITTVPDGRPPEAAGLRTIASIELRAEPESGKLTVRDGRTRASRTAAAAEEPITLTTEHVDLTFTCFNCKDGILDNQIIEVRFEVKPQVESLRDLTVTTTRCSNCQASVNPASLAGPVWAGERFTISFRVNALDDRPFDLRFQVTALPVKPCRVRVWFNSFIHRAHPIVVGNVPVGTFAGSSYFNVPFVPEGSLLDVVAGLTDQRPFNSNVNASARTHSEVILEVKENQTPTMRPAGGFHTTNRTIALVKTLWLPVCNDFQGTQGLSWALLGSSGLTSTIRLTGSARHACFEWIPAPYIDFDGILSVTNDRTMAGTVALHFEGMVDHFPSFEMYASDGGAIGSLIFAEPNFGNGLVSLAGGAAVPVSGSQTVNCPL